jgi:hypothetical protein
MTRNLTYAEFIEIVRSKFIEIYAEQTSTGCWNLVASPMEGLIISTTIPDGSAEWLKIQPYVNKPIRILDKRIISHDFANPESWPLVDGVHNAHFEVIPPAGWKYYLTSCLVRFPVDVCISPTNSFHLRMWLSSDGVSAPQPVIAYDYNSLGDLIQKSNTPIHILDQAIPDAYNKNMVEIKFEYSDPNTLQGTPIPFRSSLGEKFELYFTDNTIPFKDKDGVALTNSCYIILNCKRTPEF